MNYDDFFNQAAQLDLRAPRDPANIQHHSSLNNEALFQLPLLAMVILTLAKGRSKPHLPELGQLVGESLERTVDGFKGSSQGIGWSANLRIRTVKALTFLERAGLVDVDATERRVAIRDKGREILDFVQKDESPLSYALQIVERSYENIRAERRIESEVT